MGASGSMFDGVSGLDNHQQWMNVIGNNIANVNTAGYKSQQFNFADVISQTIRGASSSVSGGPGGTNAEQVGLGVNIGSIISNQQQGSLQTTNLPTDFAIQGDGFFIVNDGVADHYTRDSNFIVDGFGNINMAATGFHLRGYGLKQSGNTVSIDTSKVVNLTVPQQINPAQQTNVLDLFGNLQSNTTDNQTQSIGVYDSLGQLHNVILTFEPPTAAGGDWFVSASSADLASGARIDVTGGNDLVNNTAGSGTTGGKAALHFNSLGQLDGTITPLFLQFNDGSATSGLLPPEPWLIPGTTTTTNATQAAVQLNLVDTSVGSMTAFASPTALQTQAVANAAPLVGTQNNNTVTVTGNLQYASSATTTPSSQTTLTFNAADSNGFVHTFTITETETVLNTAPTTTSTWQITNVRIDGFTVAITSSATATNAVFVGGSAQFTGPSTNSVLATTSPATNGIFTVTVPSSFFATSTNFPGASITGFNTKDLNSALTITLDESKVTNTTLASGLNPASTGGAGNSAGSLKDFTVDKNGVLHGVYTNGFTQTIGQILLALFENPGGLEHEGNNTFQISANSGVVNVGTPGSGKFGTLAEGNIETSNVDLATEFSNMILAERGFQANSRIITTSDQMLQEVVDLKR